MGKAITLLLTLGVGAAGAGAQGRGDPARTLTFTAQADATAAERVVPMFFDKRLTVVMPGPVRMAVPGSPDVLAAHVKDNVVVVTLVDSPFVRQTRPVSNLTIIGADELAFACRITVAAGPEGAPDLVRVTRGKALALQASDQVLQVVRAWLTEGPAALTPETAAALGEAEGLLDGSARQRMARWAAGGGVEALFDSPRRTKAGFIYLSAVAAARVGADGVLQASVINHSQPTFTVGAVRALGPDGRPVAGLRWAMPDPVVPDDGEPRPLGVVGPADALKAGTLEVCERAAEPRCVRLALD